MSKWELFLPRENNTNGWLVGQDKTDVRLEHNILGANT
jgi:hypothetical protein